MEDRYGDRLLVAIEHQLHTDGFWNAKLGLLGYPPVPDPSFFYLIAVGAGSVRELIEMVIADGRDEYIFAVIQHHRITTDKLLATGGLPQKELGPRTVKLINDWIAQNGWNIEDIKKRNAILMLAHLSAIAPEERQEYVITHDIRQLAALRILGLYHPAPASIDGDQVLLSHLEAVPHALRTPIYTAFILDPDNYNPFHISTDEDYSNSQAIFENVEELYHRDPVKYLNLFMLVLITSDDKDYDRDADNLIYHEIGRLRDNPWLLPLLKQRSTSARFEDTMRYSVMLRVYEDAVNSQ